MLEKYSTLQVMKLADRCLQEKNKEAVNLVKDELEWEIMKEIVGFRSKTYSYLRENNDELNIVKGTKTFVVKRKLKFQS